MDVQLHEKLFTWIIYQPVMGIIGSSTNGPWGFLTASYCYYSRDVHHHDMEPMVEMAGFPLIISVVLMLIMSRTYHCFVFLLMSNVSVVLLFCSMLLLLLPSRVLLLYI